MINQLPTDRTFGVEFEGFGISQYTLAAAIERAGIDCVTNHYSGSNYSVWQVKPDGSINGARGFEVVSPVLRGAEGLEQVRKVLAIVRELGGDANKSCGMHIHWGVADWRIKQFRNFYKRWAKFERGIDSIMPNSRRADNAYYCKSVFNRVVPQHTQAGFAIKDVCEIFFAQVDGCRSLRQLDTLVLGGGRYGKLNAKKFNRTGTIEIRNHSGTFNEEKVMHWIALTASLVANADAGKAIKNWTSDTVDAKQALDTLLGAAVRVGVLDASTRTFYRNRHAELNGGR